MTTAEAARMAELEDRVAFLSEVVAAAYDREGLPIPPELAGYAPRAARRHPPARRSARPSLICLPGGAA